LREVEIVVNEFVSVYLSLGITVVWMEMVYQVQLSGPVSAGGGGGGAAAAAAGEFDGDRNFLLVMCAVSPKKIAFAMATLVAVVQVSE
jgi:hypothetical protein